MSEVFLQDLAVVMFVAGIVTVMFHRFKQPVVLGYIVAGAIIGPNTPPYSLINDEHTIELLAELGMIFLMFGLGLHFSLRKLAQVGLTAVIAAVLEIVIMMWGGYMLGQLFGWGSMNSLFLGAILAISSTTIIIKALQELGKTKTEFAKIIFGILIVEDILGIALIALLSGIAVSGSLQFIDLAGTLAQLGIFLTVVMIVGLIVVPRLIRYVDKFNSDEMLLVTTLGLCFGVSLLALKMEYSVVLGAFLIGAIIAEAPESPRIIRLVEPVKDMFSAVFFVAIGMLIDPAVLRDYAIPILIISLVVILGKVFSCGLGTLIAGHDPRTSLRVGMGLAQIGEFSFILASLGLTLKVTDPFLYPVAVTVSSLTTLATPYLIKNSDNVYNLFERMAPAPLRETIKLYGRWGDDHRARRSRAHGVSIRGMLIKWAIQIGLNLALMAGLFITASAAVNWQGMPQEILPEWAGGTPAALWFIALILGLPLLVASYRKLRAVGMVIAELTVRSTESGQANYAMRALVSNTFLAATSVLLSLHVLLLGSALLPPWPILFVLLLIITLVCVLSWRSLVRVYSRAQGALHDTLSEPMASHDDDVLRTVPHLLETAELCMLTLPAGSVATGKAIHELALRNESGASIVGIERDGVPIINPSASEVLHPGDRILLLGDKPQIESARIYLLQS